MLDINNHFGIDVEDLFNEWFNGEYAAEFAERYPGKSISLVILNPDSPIQLLLDRDIPLKHAIIDTYLGDERLAEAPDGLRDNVEGKLRYVLTSMGDSVEAEANGFFFRPGMFPWQGAGENANFCGGVSGLAKEEDWAEFCKCSDKLAELLTAVGNVALKKTEELRSSDSPPIGARYGRGVVVSLEDVQTEIKNLQAQASQQAG